VNVNASEALSELRQLARKHSRLHVAHHQEFGVQSGHSANRFDTRLLKRLSRCDGLSRLASAGGSASG
jgi:hypothetical protein